MYILFMPRKPKTKRKRRTTKTRIAKAAPIGKSLGFPSKNRVQLRFVRNFEMSDAIGGIVKTHMFRANSIFAPDATAGSHQPLGHDNWNDFYNHYRVVESKLTIAYHSYSQVAAQPPAVSGLYLADDQTIPINWTTLAESGRGSYQLEGNLNTDSRHMTMKYTQSGFFKSQGKNQSQLGAAMGSNPTEQAFFVVWIQSADESAIVAPRSYLATIDYIVEFSEPKDLAQS